MKIHATLLADLHTGAIPNDRLIKEINEIYIYNMRNMKQLDVIFILGDFFHSKAFANDASIDAAIMIMHNIICIAKEKNAKIRIIYGTESHDAEQYKLFRMYETDPDIDFKVIKNCSEEELFPNIKVLYIPEEYIMDKNEYYANFFNEDDKYDLVLGHGVIKEVMTNATRGTEGNKNNSGRLKVPYFSSYELSRICKGKVFFGHYHEQTNIDDKVYYVGSYSRWIFGEEKDKGYYELKIKDNEYKAKFITNYLAKTYKTFNYGYDSEIFNSEKDFIKELKKLDTLIKYGMYDNIRLILNIPDNFENPNLIMELVKNKYKNNKKIKLMITNGIADKMKKLHEEKVDAAISKYSVIFDKNLPLEEKIRYFIKNKYSVDITIEDIKNYLYSDIEVILQGD